jgi:hypothetical protein
MAIEIYGRRFETNSRLDVELFCFRSNLTVEKGGRGKAGHFKEIITAIWDDFIWYEWAHEQAEAICEHDITGFTSGASSGKSDMLARYALVSWYSNPTETLIIVCSTTSQDARQRVWGSIVKFHRQARAKKCSVGNLIETQMLIRLSEKTDGVAASDNSSICLVAAGNEDKDNALKRLQGRKQRNLVVILDELQDCSQTIIDAAMWNLSANAHFEVHAAGNAASRFDPHGMFLQPVDGWNSINRFTHKWKIKVGLKEGLGIHFDATSEESPNMKRFSKGEPELTFLRKASDSIGAKLMLGESNATYMRQFVGFWSDRENESNYIVTDQALASHEAYDGPEWRSPPTELAGIDPSYSTGGDRFIFAHCRWGLTTHGVWTFAIHELIHIRPVPIPGETKDDGAIRECKRIASERDISPRLIGIDASAGSPILSIAHRTWSNEILGVQFGGSATELPISQHDKRIASDVYANATSELAYVFVEFLNAGQVRGIKPDLAKELTARKFEIVTGGKIKIEKKADVKARLGFSPDLADAMAVCLMALRNRLKIQAGASAVSASSNSGDWRKLQHRMDITSRSEEAMQQTVRNHFR